MDSSVLICIFNYKHDENARRWLNLLSPHFETYVLDSGNSNKIDDFVQYPNIYYSGLFNETKKLAEKKKYSWIGIICSDVTIQDDQEELFINCIYWLTTTTNVGIWQAGPSKTSRSVHGHISNDGDYQYKKYIEGWMQFARADIINEIPYINLKENKYGWNIDSVCEIIAYYKKLSVLMDNRCEVYHPAERGYAETPARKEGKEWENKTLTKLHMRRIREAEPTITNEVTFKYNYDISFVIPSRERDDMKIHLEKNLAKYFDNYKYEIIYAEQDNNDLFRLGQLRNIGAMRATGKYIIVQDVDIIHLRKLNIDEIANDTGDSPIRLFNKISQLTIDENEEYTITKTERRGGTGACVLFTRQAWNKWNGYSNLFRGWGSEDDAFREYSKIKTYPQDLGHITHPRANNLNKEATQKNSEIYFDYILEDRINHYNDGYRQETYCGNTIHISNNIQQINVKKFGICTDYKYKDLYSSYDKFENWNSKKIVIYTCITGNYDNLIEQPYFDNCDYVCYTDKEISSTIWEIRPIPENLLKFSLVKQQRYIKTHPHEFFKEYDISIWIDGNVEIISNPSSLIDKKYDIKLPCHPIRNCLYDEANICIKLKKDVKDVIMQQTTKYRREGFPKKFGLPQTNIIIRKHNSRKCIKFMNSWWAEIEKGSHRDQLSFSYIQWKMKNINICFIDKYIYKSEYFNWNGNHTVKQSVITDNASHKKEKIVYIPKPVNQTKENTTIKVINKPTVIKTLEAYKLPIKSIIRRY